MRFEYQFLRFSEKELQGSKYEGTLKILLKKLSEQFRIVAVFNAPGFHGQDVVFVMERPAPQKVVAS